MKRFSIVLGILLGGLLAAPATAKTNEKINAWPLFLYAPEDGETHIEVLGPFFTMKRSADENLYRYLLISAYKRDTRKGETTWDLIWPIWRVQRDDQGHFRSRFFPLFFGRDDEKKYAVLFPEFWWFDWEDDDYTIVLFPWARHYEADDDYINFLTPIIWGRSGDKLGGCVLPIAFWFYRAEDDYTFFVFPFFRHIDGDTKSVTGFLPWWVSRKGDKRFANLFPVLWQKRGEELDFLLVLPLYYRVKDNDVFFPFYWDVGETLLVVPFYGKGKLLDWEWETILPPAYIRWGNDDYTEHDVLWPIVAWGDGEERVRRAFRPVYEYDKKDDYAQHSILQHLGAYGRGGGRRLDRFFPLFNFDRSEERRDLAILWPLYRDKAEKNSRARSVLTPLPIGLYRLVKPFDSWHALNLFWWGKSRKDEGAPGIGEKHGLYPLYSFEKETKNTSNRGVVASKRLRLLDPLTPLNWRHFEMSKFPILSWFFPLFEASKDDKGGAKCLMPLGLFRWEKQQIPREWRRLNIEPPFVFDYYRLENERRDLHVLTLFWDIVRPPSRSQGLWPIYTYKRIKDGGLNVSFLDPLWFWGEATGEEEHVSALFKIFDYRRKPNGDSRFNFIWRAYRRDVRGDAVSVEAFPFLNWEKSPDGSRFSFLWRLFAYEKRDGRRSLRLFFSPPIALRDRSR